VRPLVENLLAFLIVVAGVLAGLGIFLWATSPSFKSPFSPLSDCSQAPASCQFLVLPLAVVGIVLPLVVIVDIVVGWKRLLSKLIKQGEIGGNPWTRKEGKAWNLQAYLTHALPLDLICETVRVAVIPDSGLEDIVGIVGS